MAVKVTADDVIVLRQREREKTKRKLPTMRFSNDSAKFFFN